MSNHLSLIDDAVKATMIVMRDTLDKAAKLTGEGCICLEEGNRNGAIGTIVDLERLLREATALYQACLTLHRQ